MCAHEAATTRAQNHSAPDEPRLLDSLTDHDNQHSFFLDKLLDHRTMKSQLPDLTLHMESIQRILCTKYESDSDKVDIQSLSLLRLEVDSGWHVRFISLLSPQKGSDNKVAFYFKTLRICSVTC